jgi:hypothetical protein
MEYVRNTPLYRSPCKVPHASHYKFLLKNEFFSYMPFEVYIKLNMVSSKDLVWEIIMKLFGDEITDNYNTKCKGQ